MSAAVGQILEILEIPEVLHLYNLKIRNLQPADLLRRLESEKVSTRGHMSELRGRLLRLQVIKSHPHLEVPWFPEDFALEERIPKLKDDLLTTFFKLTRHQEMELQKTQLQSAKETKQRRWVECQKETIEEQQDTFEMVLARLEKAMREHLNGDDEKESQMHESVMYSSSIFENGDKIADEIETVFEKQLVEEVVDTESVFDDTDESIVKINSDQESFQRLDEESTGSWDGESKWSSFVSSVQSIQEVE